MSSRVNRWLLIIEIIFISFLVLSMWLGANFNLAGDPVNTIMGTAISPDGRYKATVFERDCGATTNFAEHVALQPRDSRQPIEQCIVFTMEGNNPMSACWLGPRCLKITYDTKTNLFHPWRSYDTWRDVTIICVYK
ncbi:MAG TPA: hypothetical protein VHV83_19095 [Armatimonadota bacterium]|nr:hypothetical protein [Armatimonadota bacterium]